MLFVASTHVCMSFLPFFFLSLSPVVFYFTRRNRHTSLSLSLSIYSHGISKRAFPTQQGGGGFGEPALLFPDTCQSLICHLCAEMEMSRSDTTCQSWRWRLIALRRLLNQSHSLQLVCWLGVFLPQAFRWILFVIQWCHTTYGYLSCNAVDLAWETYVMCVCLHMLDHINLQVSLECAYAARHIMQAYRCLTLN